MANTVIDPTTLVGAKSSPWRILKNADITFVRVLSTKEDPNTGNEIPRDTETLLMPAYFKKSALKTSAGTYSDDGTGVPIGTYPVINSYTVGILPDWAKELSNYPELECYWKGLGRGIFTFQGKGHVVKDEVEKAGKGSQVQGYFTLGGSVSGL
jgi:hypothetical protein